MQSFFRFANRTLFILFTIRWNHISIKRYPGKGIDMELEEYARFDGLGLADLVKKKEVTVRELTETMLMGVQKINPKINAILEVYEERMARADDLLLSPTPFSGVPFFLKDLGAAEAGKPQERGSRLAKGFIAEKETYLTRRFIDAGLIIMGRTATPELGLAATTESILTGATRNPWNPDLSAGGSSGGAAAAVAAGILPVAHASDGGGSIRIPASCCGLVGLKPSRGRVTSGPDADEGLFGLAQEFVVSRTVRDTAAMLDAVSKPAPGEPFLILRPRQSYMKEVGAPAQPLRIAFADESWAAVEVNSEIAGKVRNIAKLCEDMGHRVENARPQFDLEPFYAALGVMWGSSLRFTCDQLAEKMNRPVNADHLEPITYEIYQNAGSYSAADVIQARLDLNGVRRKVGQFFQNFDLFITPTLARLPVPLGTVHLDQKVAVEEWYDRTAQFNTFTNLSNATGFPAISLPLCQSRSGLPIGIQFVAGFGQEGLLIRVAGAFEQALPWTDRRPPIHISR
jgi:amidase